MRPEKRSRVMLAITRSKAKMYEYGLPEPEHIEIRQDPARLLPLAVGMLGDVAAGVSRRSGMDAAQAAEVSSDLRFAARYFDAYTASKLAQVRDPHLLLLASAAYYLCDLPGSAGVLASRVQPDGLDLDAGGFEHLLWWLLRGEFLTTLEPSGPSKYRDGIARLTQDLKMFYELWTPADDISETATRLRQTAYDEGTARELLFADACSAIVRRRIENSARHSLPKYSGLPLEVWQPTLRKASFMRELWPAQHLLGQQGVFAGEPAVVQMPTSAGKTHATELIIRSAFMKGKASLAIVVGPFRALCHEIRESLARAFRGEDVSVDELSDVSQRDFDIDELVADHAILVMTPEKLVYVLRQDPELTNRIGVLVLDEGHQFDAGHRGVTYELLVTTLKELIPKGAQKVLISAVITNAMDIAEWLHGNKAAVVHGPDLLPTDRSVAFASWMTSLGQLHFVVPGNPDEEEFFVPRVIRSSSLNLRPRDSKQRRFPVKDDSQSIALYLGLRLVRNGAVAIFCGRKDTATKLCETLVDVFDRGLELPNPADVSDAQETERVAFIYERNLGVNAAASLASKMGAFTHHGNTPHGVRLAVEHAIKEGSGRFVFCTSTLAQGVNLPIRYLIVTTSRQGGEKIKVRDFHNLMGRAGRSGMHTEGSVLFSNPEVYDTRESSNSKWSEFKTLLQPSNSEPCASTLLAVLDPLMSNGGQVTLAIDPLDVVRAHVADEAGRGTWIDEAATSLTRRWFSTETLRRQLVERREALAAVESFLLAHWQESGEGQSFGSGPVGELARHTLAYYLASSEQRTQLIQLFELLAENLAARVTDSERRSVYSRTLFGVGDTIALEQWVSENREQISACENDHDMFDVVWPCIEARIANNTFRKLRPSQTRKVFAQGWIAGESFGELHSRMLTARVRIGLGSRPRRPKVEHAVEMGENALGFDGSHVLGAVTELFELLNPDHTEAIAVLQVLQKRLKYGLSSDVSIRLYEAGFADRPLAIDLNAVVSDISSSAELAAGLRRDRQGAEGVLSRYPQYFHRVFERVIG